MQIEIPDSAINLKRSVKIEVGNLKTYIQKLEKKVTRCDNRIKDLRHQNAMLQEAFEKYLICKEKAKDFFNLYGEGEDA